MMGAAGRSLFAEGIGIQAATLGMQAFLHNECRKGNGQAESGIRARS